MFFLGNWGAGVTFPFAVPIEPKAKRTKVEQWMNNGEARTNQERSSDEARGKRGEVSFLPMPRSTRTRTRARLVTNRLPALAFRAEDATQYARTREV